MFDVISQEADLIIYISDLFDHELQPCLQQDS